MLIFLRAIAEKALEYLFLTNLILSRVAGMGSFFSLLTKGLKRQENLESQCLFKKNKFIRV